MGATAWIAKLKVVELKEELKQRGLAVAGLKKDLVDRLTAAVEAEPNESASGDEGEPEEEPEAAPAAAEPHPEPEAPKPASREHTPEPPHAAPESDDDALSIGDEDAKMSEDELEPAPSPPRKAAATERASPACSPPRQSEAARRDAKRRKIEFVPPTAAAPSAAAVKALERSNSAKRAPITFPAAEPAAERALAPEAAPEAAAAPSSAAADVSARANGREAAASKRAEERAARQTADEESRPSGAAQRAASRAADRNSEGSKGGREESAGSKRKRAAIVFDAPEPKPAEASRPRELVVERVVEVEEPAGATRALLVEGMRRPLTERAFRDLLEQTGTIEQFWMNAIKTHAYVVLADVAQADATLIALRGFEWPQGQQSILQPKFVTLEEATAAIETRGAAVLRRAGSAASGQLGPRGASGSLANSGVLSAAPPTPRTAPTADGRAGRRGSLGAPEQPPAKARATVPPVEEEPAPSLEDFFRKTLAKPVIYWQALTDDEAAAKEAERVGKVKP